MPVSQRQIWKFPLEIKDGPQNPGLPENAEILLVAMQNGNLCMWAEVDIRDAKSNRLFVVIGTGHPLYFVGKHVGSVIDGGFVWHVMEAL